ncbi:hypothetical protein, partial [uncultured Desulfovibrio sp.]|uniref:hypothetical protein n=1 Tax=uncultured Desulfovibrio sp. TaxID=167968 RepID=UPI00265D246D
ECNLAKVEVAGSNPVSRSSEFRGFLFGESPFFCTRIQLSQQRSPVARRPGGSPALPQAVKKRAVQAKFLLFLPLGAI